MAEVRVRALSLGRSPVPPDLPRGGTHLAGLEIFKSAVASDSLCLIPWSMLVSMKTTVQLDYQAIRLCYHRLVPESTFLGPFRNAFATEDPRQHG